MKKKLTGIYLWQPMYELHTESVVKPLMPKSQTFNSAFELIRIFEGLMSRCISFKLLIYFSELMTANANFDMNNSGICNSRANSFA